MLGARTPHELLSMIVRVDSINGHLIRNRKTGPGWISYSRMGAFFPKIHSIFNPDIRRVLAIYSYKNTTTKTASILQILQLPPAKEICSISHSRDHLSVNECFHRCPQTMAVWKCISARKYFTYREYPQYLFRDCVLRIVPYS